MNSQYFHRAALLCSRRVLPSARPSLFAHARPRRSLSHRHAAQPARALLLPRGRRSYATSHSAADNVMESIQEQYATAKDEFEIAVEETEKKTVYAADDRAAAAAELQKLKEIFEAAMRDEPPEVAAEIRSRAGQRIRELDGAIKGLEESAQDG